MSNKKPDTYSAAVTARVISRRMRKAGFKMADTSDKYNWTEGVCVHRVGYGSVVSVDYHMPSRLRGPDKPEERKRYAEEKARIQKWLLDNGYLLSEQGWVVCEKE